MLLLLLKGNTHRDPAHIVQDREETCNWSAGTQVWGELGAAVPELSDSEDTASSPQDGRTWKAVEGSLGQEEVPGTASEAQEAWQLVVPLTPCFSQSVSLSHCPY